LSTAENSVNDTSIALICGFIVSNRRRFSRQGSDSAARAAESAPNAITSEHSKAN
jgi:hypothetical protein